MKQIVKFGKYKGASVETLLSDKNYCQWLLAQTWFAEKYSELAQLLTHGVRPKQTPAHNALQLKFLQPEYTKAFALTVSPRLREVFFWSEEPGILDAFGWRVETIYIQSDPEFEFEGYGPPYTMTGRNSGTPSRYAHDVRFFASCEKRILNAGGEVPPEVELLQSLRREKNQPSYRSGRFLSYSQEELAKELPDSYTHKAMVEANRKVELLEAELLLLEEKIGPAVPPDPVKELVFQVEVKPVVEDDYPEVLRQMVANCSTVVLVGEFNSAVATPEQLYQIFKSRHKLVIMESSVLRMLEKIYTPPSAAIVRPALPAA